MGLIVTSNMINDRLAHIGKDARLIGSYEKSKIKSLFECSLGHTWMATPDNVLRRSGCPECFGIEHKIRSETYTHTKEDFQSYLLEDHRGIKIIGDYINNATKTLFECGVGHQWVAVPRNIKSGRGCPKCAKHGYNPSKPGWIYLLDFGNFIKYGISNDLKYRLYQHKKNGTFTVVHSIYHHDGQLALDWENSIKRTYGGRFATKEQCFDGWTETLSIDLIKEIISTMDWGGGRISRRN